MSESLAWAMVPARAAMKLALLIWFLEKNSRPYCKMASPNKVMIGPTTTNSTMALPRWRGATDAGVLGRFMADWAQAGYPWIQESGFSVKQNLVTCPGGGLECPSCSECRPRFELMHRLVLPGAPVIGYRWPRSRQYRCRLRADGLSSKQSRCVGAVGRSTGWRGGRHAFP